MDSLSLTHPVERYLIGITLLALAGVLYWNAGETVLPRESTPEIVRSL